MKLRDLYRTLAIDPDLNLDSEVVVDVYTCCGIQDSLIVGGNMVEVDSDLVRIGIDIGSCREYGGKVECKNLRILNLILKELEDSNVLPLFLTSKNSELREYIENKFK